MIQIDIYHRNYGNVSLMTAERYEYAIVNVEGITLRKRLHIYTIAYEKKLMITLRKMRYSSMKHLLFESLEYRESIIFEIVSYH